MTSVVGVRFALDPGRHRESVPVRSALLGAVLAVTVIVATLTFGSSLNTLISRPALYGWNWNYALLNAPPQSTSLLNADPYVAAWSGYFATDIQVDGTTVPVLMGALRAKVESASALGPRSRRRRSNRARRGDDAAAPRASRRLRPRFVWQLKEAPIDVPPMRLLIVGTSTLPAVGTAGALHPSMGTGAIISASLEPPAMSKALKSPIHTLDGPALVFVRLRSGAPSAQALASLDKIAAAGDRAFAAVPDGQAAGDSVIVETVQYPAEIENYRSIGVTPVVLALALTAGAVVALGLTLAASVRGEERRNLALLRALGFTGRQLMVTIAWQASVAGLVGVVVGVPAGILLGQWSWTLFARYIDAVPEPTGQLFQWSLSPSAPSCWPTSWQCCGSKRCEYSRCSGAPGRVIGGGERERLQHGGSAHCVQIGSVERGAIRVMEDASCWPRRGVRPQPFIMNP